MKAGLKMPERGGVVLDQPQPATPFPHVGFISAGYGWSATPPRSFFKQAPNDLAEILLPRCRAYGAGSYLRHQNEVKASP